jgi:hypothetical protein
MPLLFCNPYMLLLAAELLPVQLQAAWHTNLSAMLPACALGIPHAHRHSLLRRMLSRHQSWRCSHQCSSWRF